MRFTNRQILKITFPVLLSLMMEQLIGLTDTIYLGHVGEVELGASAIAGIFYLTIFMVGFGFSIGAQVLIARRNGEGNLAGIGPIFMQGMYHDFEVEPGTGPVLIGEVSQCNDDNIDNRFNPPAGRFPEIEEDEPPYRLLCNEYPEAPEK